MVESQFSKHVCKLQRALYGLKQAPRAWFDKLSDFLIFCGFFCSLVDPSLFVCHSDQAILALLLYVDGMLLTGSSTMLVNSFIQILSREFSMKDLRLVHHFLELRSLLHLKDFIFLNPTMLSPFLSDPKC